MCADMILYAITCRPELTYDHMAYVRCHAAAFSLKQRCGWASKAALEFLDDLVGIVVQDMHYRPRIVVAVLSPFTFLCYTTQIAYWFYK